MELTSDLAKRFPQSELVRDDRELDDDLQKVLRFVETPSSGLTLELAMRGTPFQQRVWEELIKVLPGGSSPTRHSPHALANRRQSGR